MRLNNTYWESLRYSSGADVAGHAPVRTYPLLFGGNRLIGTIVQSARALADALVIMITLIYRSARSARLKLSRAAHVYI